MGVGIRSHREHLNKSNAVTPMGPQAQWQASGALGGCHALRSCMLPATPLGKSPSRNRWLVKDRKTKVRRTSYALPLLGKQTSWWDVKALRPEPT